MKIGLWVGMVLLVGVTILSWGRCIVFQHRLRNYLFKNHNDKWKELTSIGDLGPGFANSRKGLRFLFNREDFNDTEVSHLKIVSRNSFLYVVTGFLAIFFWACIMVGILGKMASQ